MMIRSMSGLDRSSSTSYVVLPPGMPVIATTPAQTPCCEKELPMISENAIVTTGLISSLLIFFMWVGAWGCIDTLVGMISDVPIYQIYMYGGILVTAALILWIQLARLKAGDSKSADFNV
jgi:hypothetical protein